MSTSRDVVFKILSQWSVLANPPLLPDRPRDTTAPTPGESSPRAEAAFLRLSARDRAFAFDLITGVLRWRHLLDAVIASRLRQSLETLDLPVRALFWLGAYQLLIQGGTSDYAAVDTAVDLAGKNPRTARAGGLVNAVLRGITRLKPQVVTVDAGKNTDARLSRKIFALDFSTDIHLAENIFPDPATAMTAHLAAVRSHPALLVDHLRRLYPHAAADLLLRNNLRPVVTLRVDAPGIDVPAAAGLVAHATVPRFLVATAGWNVSLDRLVRDGTLSPQDPTAARPVLRLTELVKSGRVAAPATILDLCAGLGTKSIQLARAFAQARITSSDIDSVKLGRLELRAQEIRQKNITAVSAETLTGATAKKRAAFDLVLADVPCSNTGVMSKRVQSRWRWPTLNRAELRALQLRLIQQASSLVGEKGSLIYATCSIDPAENGDIVRELHGWRVLEEQLTLSSIGADASQSTSFYDGGYFAILSR